MSEQDRHPAQQQASGKLEREEARLWRVVLLFLVFLATALAALSWERLHTLPYHLGLLPLAALFVAVCFAAFSYGRRRQVSELHQLMRGLQDRNSLAPNEEQLDQLSNVIARSQRSFKELIDSLDDVAFAIALDGTLRTVNRRLTELLAIPYNQIVSHKLDEFVEEPDRAHVESGIPRFLEKRRWSGLVKVRLRNSARPLYFDCVLNAILKAGEVVGVSVWARDLTEQREKEQRFTELFETLHEGVYFSTPEGKLLDANPALVQILGYASLEEVLRLDAGALNVDPGLNPVLGHDSDDRGGVRSREVKIRRKDGSTAICSDTSKAVWDAEGKIVRYQGTLIDITERRAMETQLLQQEEFQRRLLESFPDLILVIDMQETYTFVSSRLRDLLGYRVEDLLGKRLSDLREHSPEFISLYREVSSGEKKFGLSEFPARHRDGGWRTMRATASVLYGAENSPIGVIISVRDVTVDRKLEQQVIQSERLAAMGQMIGGFAHELNNPLTSILGVSEMLQESDVSDPIRKQLALLQQQSRRAAEIVQNLMYFSRPPAPGRTQISVPELVQRTLHLQAYALRKSNITVDFAAEPDLPQVSGDPHQLMQVFLNLILNAEQAMREVRDRGTLRVRLSRGEGAVAVTFQDDGPGIAPEILPHIFDPFYTTKRPGRGTGLGLSICKSIMKEYNGNVEATSAPNGGAVFSVTIPAAPKEQAAQF